MATSNPQQNINNMNNFPYIQKTYVHHFRYLIAKELQPNIKDTLFITSNYDKITGVTPTQIIPQDQSILYLKVVTSKEIVHTAKTTLELKKFGLTLKLNSTQMDRNSIFCNSGPALMANLSKERIMEELTNTNPHLTILDTYVIPPKNIQQKLISFKLTLLTQQMVNEAMEKGINAYGHFLDSSKISRAKQLTKIQCSKCNTIGHGASKCKGQVICFHCTGNHNFKDCSNKSDSPTCSNCGGNHRATSNTCNYKKKFLAIPPSNNVINEFIKNPESNYSYPAPPPKTNPWTNRKFNNNEESTTNNSVQQNDQMNFTTLSPSRGKSVKRPNPYQLSNQNLPSTSSDKSNQYELPTPLTSQQNNSNDDSQTSRNTGARPKTINNFTPYNNTVNDNNKNNTTNNVNNFHKVTENGNNVFINNVQPDPKPLISYNECLLMARQFEDWPTAFTELQFAFGISPVIAIPATLHNRLKFVDCITPNNPTTLSQNSISTKNTSPTFTSSDQNSQTLNNNIVKEINKSSSQSSDNLKTTSNNHTLSTSINNLIKNSRESKDVYTTPKNKKHSPLNSIDKNQYEKYLMNKDNTNNNIAPSLKNTLMFNSKKVSSSNFLETINENEDSHNSTSSSIDGDLQICENSLSSQSSEEETIIEKSPHTSTPINNGMGPITRSKSTSNLYPSD